MRRRTVETVCRTLVRRARRMRARARLRRFGSDERGSLIIFGLLAFVAMLGAAGMAIDVMRYETERERLQATLDRAVLAAAALNQTLDPKEVVIDYFAKAGIKSDYTLDVQVNKSLYFKKVSATATVTQKNFFLNLVGIRSLSVSATGAAKEEVRNVEISLVLDISGSMGSYHRLTNLKVAAKDFVDTMLKPGNEKRISISLIPYSGQVNIGSDLAGQLKIARKHGYSHCIAFGSSDFATAALDLSRLWAQDQHFAWSASSYHPIREPWCPTGVQSYEGQGGHDDDYAIVPFSNSRTRLKAAIDKLQPISATGIHYGVKWGAALLDPSVRPAVTNLVALGKVSSYFSGRPAAYSDTDTLKVLVLMTDGENVDQYRIRDWAYNSKSEYDYWNTNALWWYLYRYVGWWSRSAYYKRIATASDADRLTLKACAAAKDAGTTIFTIAFEAPPAGRALMKKCASSEAHYYEASGSDISSAFSAIANTIQKLKLVN